MRAALYARFSTDEQNPRSADDQLALAREFAARQGFVVVAEFKDEAISGMHDNRPGARALLAAARRLPRPFDVVVTEGLERLARSGGGLFDAFEDLDFLGVPIHTLDRGRIDQADVAVAALVSTLTIGQVRAKVRRGLKAVVDSGRYPSRPPYGYRPRLAHDSRGERIRGLIEIDEAQAAIVRRIHAEYGQGLTPDAIVRRLNAEGVPGARGRPWTVTTIRGRAAYLDGILRNPIYAGEVVWNRTGQTKDRRTGQTRTRGKPQDEWVRRAAPELRIVDADAWARTQALLAATAEACRERGNASAGNAPRRLLTGMVRCGCCGGGMNTSGPVNAYRCIARMQKGPTVCANARAAPAARVEAEVMAQLRRDLLHPEVVEAYVKEYHAAQRRRTAGAGAERARLERDLADARGQAERLVDSVAAGLLTGPTVAAKLQALEARAADLGAQLQRHAARAEVVTLHPHAAKRYRQQVEALAEALARHEAQTAKGGANGGPNGGGDADEAERADARQKLRQVVRAVIVHPEPGRGQWRVELDADLTTLLGLGQPAAPPSAAAR